MVDHRMDIGRAEDGELFNGAEDIPAEQLSPVSLLSNSLCSEMSLPELAAQCSREIDNYCKGEPGTEEYSLELLRRAIVQEDEEAWAGVQHCFGGLVRGWLRRHPKGDVASLVDSEENYVSQTFERFRQTTALNRCVEFNTLAAALRYLHASLNGVILDTLRAYARTRKVMLPKADEAIELHAEDTTDRSLVWEALQTMFSDEREKRLAFLLFHGGLKPGEIIRFCPQEWDDVREIYRLRRNITERLLHNADQLRWR